MPPLQTDCCSVLPTPAMLLPGADPTKPRRLPNMTTTNEAQTDIQEEKPKCKPRGFATMSKEKIREISSKGGKTAHAMGTAHQFTPAEAAAAGRKGGLAPHVNRGPRPAAEKASGGSDGGVET